MDVESFGVFILLFELEVVIGRSRWDLGCFVCWFVFLGRVWECRINRRIWNKVFF